MIRCGSLYDISILDDDYIDSKSGLDASEQLQLIYRETRKLYLLRDSIYKNLRQQLKPYMHRISHRAMKADEMEDARYYFENDVPAEGSVAKVVQYWINLYDIDIKNDKMMAIFNKVAQGAKEDEA